MSEPQYILSIININGGWQNLHIGFDTILISETIDHLTMEPMETKERLLYVSMKWLKFAMKKSINIKFMSD